MNEVENFLEMAAAGVGGAAGSTWDFPWWWVVIVPFFPVVLAE